MGKKFPFNIGIKPIVYQKKGISVINQAGRIDTDKNQLHLKGTLLQGNAIALT